MLLAEKRCTTTTSSLNVNASDCYSVCQKCGNDPLSSWVQKYVTEITYSRGILSSWSRLDILLSIFLILLFSTALGSFTRFGFASPMWLLVYAVVAYSIITDIRSPIHALISSWLVLLPPLIAFFSIFWSMDPRHTATSSVHLLYTTVIGVWIGAVYSPSRIFQALFMAAVIGVGASILNSYIGIIPAYSGHNELIGIYAQKNGMGRIIGIAAIAIFVVGVQLRKPLVALLFMLALALPLWATESASSLLVYLLILTLPILWLFTQAEKGTKIILIFMVGAAVIFFFGLLATVDIDIINKILGKLGKDSTLTGRTVLWSVALQLVEWNPILGVGYNAFWTAPAFSDLMATIQAQGETINGFHNAYLESLVATGLAGGTIFIISIFVTIFRACRKYLVDLSIERLGMIYIVASAVIFSFFDIVLYREHDINQLLMATIFSASYHRVRRNS